MKPKEPKLKLYVWHGFEPDWSGGLAFAIAYNLTEAKAAVQKRRKWPITNWGKLRKHKIEAGRAEAIGGGA
jgi:hypothetical protein